MADVVRAKFICNTAAVVKYAPSHDPIHTYEFSAVYDDGIPENQRYATHTPVGSVKITVTNPDVEFEAGRYYYYLDFTKA